MKRNVTRMVRETNGLVDRWVPVMTREEIPQETSETVYGAEIFSFWERVELEGLSLIENPE